MIVIHSLETEKNFYPQAGILGLAGRQDDFKRQRYPSTYAKSSSFVKSLSLLKNLQRTKLQIRDFICTTILKIKYFSKGSFKAKKYMVEK